jgi:hypothetical protein
MSPATRLVRNPYAAQGNLQPDLSFGNFDLIVNRGPMFTNPIQSIMRPSGLHIPSAFSWVRVAFQQILGQDRGCGEAHQSSRHKDLSHLDAKFVQYCTIQLYRARSVVLYGAGDRST